MPQRRKKAKPALKLQQTSNIKDDKQMNETKFSFPTKSLSAISIVMTD
jgi:hypothetical protein